MRQILHGNIITVLFVDTANRDHRRESCQLSRSGMSCIGNTNIPVTSLQDGRTFLRHRQQTRAEHFEGTETSYTEGFSLYLFLFPLILKQTSSEHNLLLLLLHFLPIYLSTAIPVKTTNLQPK